MYPLQAQDLGSRVEASYSIKEIDASGAQSLVMGKVFYNLGQRTLVHHHSFPQRQIIVFKDSSAFRLVADSISRTSSSAMTVEFSIYHLILSNEISEFGLRRMGFELVDVTESQGKVLSQWQYPGVKSGHVVIAQVNGLVDSVIFYDNQGKPLVKQFFKEYKRVGRFSFPSKIYETVVTPFGETKKITAHTEIKIDDYTDEADFYNIYADVIAGSLRSGGSH